MMFGSAARDENRYARYPRGVPGLHGASQRDRVGIVTFDEDVVTYVRHRPTTLCELHTLDSRGAR